VARRRAAGDTHVPELAHKVYATYRTRLGPVLHRTPLEQRASSVKGYREQADYHSQAKQECEHLHGLPFRLGPS
jgi:hypothetical protein